MSEIWATFDNVEIYQLVVCSTDHSHIGSTRICFSICNISACTTINHLQPLTRTKLCTCGVVGRHVACTLQISQSHMSHSTTSMRHTQSPVRVQTHDTVTSKLNQPCAHILHVYQCCVQLIRTHFCVYTAFTRNCAPVVLTLNSSISNKISQDPPKGL